MERRDGFVQDREAQGATLWLQGRGLLRRLRVLLYLTVALALVAVLGSFLPLGTWLLLCLMLAPPTLASAVLVATE